MKISLRVCRIIAITVVAAASLVFVVAMVFLFLQLSGENSLGRESRDVTPLLAYSVLTDTSVVEDDWQEGDVRYQGVHYRYNKDILTFLFLGIDKLSEVKGAKGGIDGGQSDAIFLLVLNPHTSEMSVIAVNRNSMTDIDIYNRDGEFAMTAVAQLAVQHGYGDGKELSCERSVKAVSNLFYGLPIHGYCAVNMGAIEALNDAVGGIELEALESFSYKGGSFKEGETVLLLGDNAYHYLHDRDVNSFDSAGRRLERQKQYLEAYAGKLVGMVKKDITLPIKLYQELSKYMVTDVALDEVSYLATQVADYSFSGDRIYSLSGETKVNGELEEFYVDEKGLYELILQVFYEEVE